MIRTVAATRYVTPLREGGSLPAIVEGDDQGTYVLKFRGAGQGEKVLVAELICAGLARALDLPMPEVVLMTLDPALGRNEPDYEIRQLLRASAGLNLALDYLPGALAFDPAAGTPDADLAARIVWFDGLVANVDRTARNTNLLRWHGGLYLIDHGAALYVHHDWPDGLGKARLPLARLGEHVLRPCAGDFARVDAAMAARLGDDVLAAVLADVPDEWLPAPAAESRARYHTFLRERLGAPRPWLEASHARG